MKGTVLVAGATGAVGTPLVRQLVDGGWRVFGTTRDSRRADALRRAGADALVVDVFDAPALDAALVSARPDVVVHQLTDLPGLRTPESLSVAIQRNARLRREGTRNLVQATLASGCPRMVAQSIAWAYAPGPLPHAETDPLDTSATGDRSVTVRAVLELESLVLNTPGLDGLVLRYGHLYGPRTWSAVRESEMPLHVEDAAHAAVCAVERAGITGAFNVSEPGPQLSVEQARHLLGWAPRIR
ncbi:MAG: NAD(P)-dependent oxidoreductase [Proteobacteria bacterium]|nr:NAD(P)-dependent oxidoreductase [Pseudomonadota bacterium]